MATLEKTSQTSLTATTDKGMFGQRAIAAGLVTDDQLDECLKLQKKYEKSGKKVPKIGEIFVHKGYLSKDQVAELLKPKKRAKRKKGSDEAAHADDHDEAESRDPEESPPAEDAGAEPEEAHAAEEVAPEAELDAESLPEDAGVEEAVEEATVAEAAPAPARHDTRANGTAAAAIKNRVKLLPGTKYATEFMVEERFESDALGDVYIARQDVKDRPVNLHVIDPAVTKDNAFKAALVDAMKVLARLEHPHVQKLISFGKSKGCYYVALEYVRGDLVAEKLRSRKPQEYGPTIEYLRQLATGLEVLHTQGVIHGQIGPTTVLLTKEAASFTRPGIPLVLAHEKAKWTRLYSVYQAPEVLAGEPPDARSDVFSLGCVVYHLLAGTAPYRADTVEEAGERIAAGAPSLRKYNQRAPAEAADLVAKMIHADPAERFPDAAALKQAIAELPSEVQTRVTMNYAAVLGEQALKAPEPEARPGGSTSQRRATTTMVTPTQPITGRPATGAGAAPTAVSTKTKTRAANYSELVAEMNKVAAEEDAKDKEKGSSKRSSVSDLRGKAYKNLVGTAERGLPKVLLKAFVGITVVGALGGGGFYWWSVETQTRKNTEMTTNPRPGIAEGSQVDPNAGKAPPPTDDETRAKIAEECQKVYTAVVDELKKMEAFDPKKDRERFDKLSRMLLEACIDKGKKKGFEWKYLADAYNLRARIEFYWVYTDKFFEVSDSVRKDHIGISHKDIHTALRLYKADGAETQFRLRLNAWMPEFQKSSRFVLEAQKKGVSEGFAEVRVTTAQQALDDLKFFQASATLPVRQQ